MPRLTPALVRGLDILELFLDARAIDGYSAPEVATVTGLPRATVHELLATLVAKSYLRKEKVSGRFHLGLRVFQLGNAYGERIDLVTSGRLIAEEIAAECNETVNVGMLDGPDVVYMAKVESRQAVRMVSAVGRRLPASCTAVGKALIAFLSEAELEALYPSAAGLPSLTPRSIVDRAELLAQLAEIRRSGLAFEAGESTPDVSCAAAPVRDHRGAVVASVSVSVPDIRWGQRAPGEWADVARRGAQRLSSVLGAR
ncbi:IclR family transcriptional regulator [Streptomyces antnestii]|uniref:IclR family transcriptional regulator n=1 Tax=Streptomyces antnestii TaxID=2494256 RepID=A0A3S2VGY1_9ACTN|nr:IclR family transcriptional regulator [Streptomyces sp. San01]RVU23043.1 IclR family transcriptional regulator [Streptomyces sp. San01]